VYCNKIWICAKVLKGQFNPPLELWHYWTQQYISSSMHTMLVNLCICFVLPKGFILLWASNKFINTRIVYCDHSQLYHLIIYLMCSFCELYLKHSLFVESLFLCVSFSYDSIIYATLFIFNVLFGYVIYLKIEHKDWVA